MPTHDSFQPWTEAATELENGQVAAKFVLGEDDDPDAAVVFVVKWPPNCSVDVHTHDSDYCELIIEGSQKIGATWYHAGDVRVASAGQYYGPLVSGDEGCTIAVIFSRNAWEPVPAQQGGRQGLNVDRLRGPRVEGSS